MAKNTSRQALKARLMRSCACMWFLLGLTITTTPKATAIITLSEEQRKSFVCDHECRVFIDNNIVETPYSALIITNQVRFDLFYPAAILTRII